MIINDDELHPKYEDEIRGASHRALAAGARPPLRYLGIGMTSVVFADGKGLAFKVARDRAASKRLVAEEAAWLRVAAQVLFVRDHVARFYRFDPRNVVIVREAIVDTSKRYGQHRTDVWKLHHQISNIMRSYGYGAPEFKAESYALVRGRGWVLFDASLAILHGRALVKRVTDILAGRETLEDNERMSDLAYEVAGETCDPADPMARCTIPYRVGSNLLVRLAVADPGALKYVQGSLRTREIAERAEKILAERAGRAAGRVRSGKRGLRAC